MTREEVEVILEDLGWVNTKRVVTSENNKSIYILWINSQDVEIYLGNWFIEIETHGWAFPYKDDAYTRDQLINFIKDEF